MPKTLSEEGARALLRQRIEEAGGVRAFARKHKLSAAFVSDVARGRRNISPRMQIILELHIVLPEVRYLWHGRQLPR